MRYVTPYDTYVQGYHARHTYVLVHTYVTYSYLSEQVRIVQYVTVLIWTYVSTKIRIMSGVALTLSVPDGCMG